MINQVFGGMPNTPMMAGAIFILICGWLVSILFSFIPMSEKYPGYAFNSGQLITIGWWTGFACGALPLIIKIAW